MRAEAAVATGRRPVTAHGRGGGKAVTGRCVREGDGR